MIIKLLTEHNLEFLRLKGGCRGSPESTHVNIPQCWKSHAMAQFWCRTIRFSGISICRRGGCFLRKQQHWMDYPLFILWASAWDFQQCGILTCVDSEKPLQPHFKLRNSKWSQKLNNHRVLKRLAKALIRLRVCAGWSEALLVAHPTLLEILCTGSIITFLELG